VQTTKLTDADGHFADRATRYLMAALFDDPERGDCWQFRALCAQTDPDLYLNDKGGSVRTPKTVCARCPVRGECLAYALENDERFGVWGGLSEGERRLLRRTSRSAADAA
jgi:WhiB family redox-sensing transcriptional regulator